MGSLGVFMSIVCRLWWVAVVVLLACGPERGRELEVVEGDDYRAIPIADVVAEKGVFEHRLENFAP